jgi:hypothetical protein
MLIHAVRMSRVRASGPHVDRSMVTTSYDDARDQSTRRYACAVIL